MKLSTFKQKLTEVKELTFRLPDGGAIPDHFHITEVGKMTHDFIDCGKTMRSESVASLQIWHANDTAHRLAPDKLARIIEKSEQALGLEDLEVEIQYQIETIGLFGLDYFEGTFRLTEKHTDCLAKETCCSPKQNSTTTDKAAAGTCC